MTDLKRMATHVARTQTQAIRELRAENEQLRHLVRAFLTVHDCRCGDTEHCITCEARAALKERKP